MNRSMLVAAVTAILCAAAPRVAAQDRASQHFPAAGHDSHWGVSASLVPRWAFPEVLEKVWNLETDMRGTELRAGVVRGSDLGGDWGVSYVKKFVDDGSVVQLHESSCVQVPGGSTRCARGAYHRTRRAGMTGVEAHVFIPFASVGRRVQIGGIFAGGIARIDGSSERFLEHLMVDGSTVTVVTDPLGIGSFKDTLQDYPREWSVVPIGRAELGVGVLVRPGVKIRASGGVNFPGFHHVGVHIHYLFGHK